MAKGPAYGKLRRVESKQGEGWEVVKTMSYRPDGKLLRQIDDSSKLIQYKYSEHGEISRIFVNGVLSYFAEFDDIGRMRETSYSKGGKRVEKHFISNRFNEVVLVSVSDAEYELHIERSGVVGEVRNSESNKALFVKSKKNKNDE